MRARFCALKRPPTDTVVDQKDNNHQFSHSTYQTGVVVIIVVDVIAATAIATTAATGCVQEANHAIGRGGWSYLLLLDLMLRLID